MSKNCIFKKKVEKGMKIVFKKDKNDLDLCFILTKCLIYGIYRKYNRKIRFG